MSGTLFIIATPIGNLEDLTPRARQTLAEVDLIAAEDTRHTGRLLSHIGVKSRLLALHDHNEDKVVAKIIRKLLGGLSVALVSDAGTPLVSDPGYRLVCAAHDNDIVVSPIPGASAVIAALSVAGLATDRFSFEGFGPAKKGARREWLQALVSEKRTMVFYESVHRIADCLADMVEILGADRAAFIGRELTKIHEQCVQDSLQSLQEMVADGTIISKGEFVVAVAGTDEKPASSLDVDWLLMQLADDLPAKNAAKIAARISGKKKNQLYDRLLQLQRSK
jgi:16S rRNA (cytidine1402-2'-O)-methyltransferase